MVINLSHSAGAMLPYEAWKTPSTGGLRDRPAPGSAGATGSPPTRFPLLSESFTISPAAARERSSAGSSSTARFLKAPVRSDRKEGGGPLRKLGLILLLLLSIAAPAPCSGEETRFGRIVILRKEVFNPSVPGYDRFPFSWLNTLHVRTKEKVIREAILFDEGDLYDPELLKETERNLRKLSFINYASVAPGERKNGEQDVVIETHDIWSTQISVDIKKAEEEGTEEGDAIEIRVEEQNLFGYGKRIELTWNRTDRRDGFGWLLYDPLFFDTRWTFRAFRRDRGEGEDRGGSLRRPFYSLDTRWGGGFRTLYESRRDRVFRDDEPVARYFRKLHRDDLTVSRMFGGRYRKLLLQSVFARERNDYSDLLFEEGAERDSSFLPSDEDLRHLALGLRYGGFRFVEDRQIDFFEQVEDIELGAYGAISFGPVWNSDARWRLSSETHVAFPTGENGYGSLYARLVSNRHPGEWRRTVLSGIVRHYKRWSRWNTLALRLLWEEAWKAPAGKEFIVGGRNGLRGYDDFSMVGQRRFLFNIENRLFTPVRILTVALGGALFFDAGAAWERGEAVRFDEIDSSFGAGLRLGLTKAKNARSVRIDLSRNLRNGSFRLEADLGHLFLIGRPFGDFVRFDDP